MKKKKRRYQPHYEYQTKRRLSSLYKRVAVQTSVTTFNGQTTISKASKDFSVVGRQTTTSRDTLFKAIDNERKQLRRYNTRYMKHQRYIINEFDEGSNFDSKKNTFRAIDREIAVKEKDGGITTVTYRGPFSPIGTGLVSDNSSYWPADVGYTNAELFALGGTAISRCQPVHPAVSLAQTLGELREGLPSVIGKELKKSGKRIHKGASGEFLNYQFGLLPVVSDLRKYADVVSKGDKAWNQYLRDAGRHVRRGYRFPTEEYTEITNLGSGRQMYPSFSTGVYTPNGYMGTLTRERKVTRKVWFSGAFVYHASFSDDLKGLMQREMTRAQVLYGIRFDAETAWNLTPWSWFADWFANSGDVISNLNAIANDGLVMRYGYIMAHTTVTDTYTHSGVSFKTAGPTGPVSWSFTTERKQRVKAHPFGFGLTDASLTPRQLAIMAALGLSFSR